MRRNSGNTCYLSRDTELKQKNPGCCSDHHAFTYNSDNCLDIDFPPVPQPTPIPAPGTPSPTPSSSSEHEPTVEPAGVPVAPPSSLPPNSEPTYYPTRSPVALEPTTAPVSAPVAPPSRQPTELPISLPPTVCECPSGLELDGDRCYQPCSTFGDHLEGTGEFCEFRCPLGYISSFAGYCLKNPTGSVLSLPSFSSQSNCEEECSDTSPTGSCKKCPAGFWTDTWHPECPWGYGTALGSCQTCVAFCPDGWEADGTYCTKPPPIKRGPGVALPCATTALNSEWGNQQQCIFAAFEANESEFDIDGVKERFGSFASIDSAQELLWQIEGGCPTAKFRKLSSRA